MKNENIWCMRKEVRWFGVSKIEDESWLIYVFGFRFWIGPNKPSFMKRNK